MKNLDFYNDVLGCKNADDVFKYIVSNLKPSAMVWTYFVNWEKVLDNTKKIEIELNTLNYLIGRKDFESEFELLVKKHPEVIKIIPALVVRSGVNTGKIKILVDYQRKKLIYDDYDFDKSEISKDDINKYLEFIEKTGLKKLLTSQIIKNLVDYMIGVEAGLDSNGRKNRSGEAMESIVEVFVSDACKKIKGKYLRQADSAKIKRIFGKEVPVDKSSRIYDFVVDNGKKLFIIETNYFGGGGSKLKSTAGEYRNLFDVLGKEYNFIWITDGYGWQKTARPLRETFDHINFLLNLQMLEKGILEFLLGNN
jgi:type II restriction enzyme